MARTKVNNRLAAALKAKLTPEAWSSIRELFDSESNIRHLSAMLQLEVRLAEQQVAEYRLDDGPDGLVIAKARYEGAKRMADNLTETMKVLSKIE